LVLLNDNNEVFMLGILLEIFGEVTVAEIVAVAVVIFGKKK